MEKTFEAPAKADKPKKRRSPRSVFFSGSWLHVVSSVLYCAAGVIAVIAYGASLDGWSVLGALPILLLFVFEPMAGFIAFYFFSYWAVDRLLRKIGARTLSARYRKWRLWAWSGWGRTLFFHILYIVVNGVLTGGMVWIGWRMFLWLKAFGELGGEGPLSGIAFFFAVVLDFAVWAIPFFLLFMVYHTVVCAVMGMLLRCIGVPSRRGSDQW